MFARENGAPLRPEYALRRFRELSDATGLPRVTLHDLRHLAATMMIAAGVPLALVSKTLRHSQVGITADLYGHLTREATHAAADALGAALDTATAELTTERAVRSATTMRPHDPDSDPAENTTENVSPGQESALGGTRTPNLLIRSGNAPLLMPGILGFCRFCARETGRLRQWDAPVRGPDRGPRSTRACAAQRAAGLAGDVTDESFPLVETRTGSSSSVGCLEMFVGGERAWALMRLPACHPAVESGRQHCFTCFAARDLPY